MKKYIYVVLLIILPNLLKAQAGFLDGSFNTSGIVINNLSNANDRLGQIMVQPDQHILVIGNDAGLQQMAIIRYKSNGMYDSTMGINGIALSPLGMIATSGTLQMDGKILACGYDANSHFALSRYHTNGVVDSSFGSNGMVNTSIGNNVIDICFDLELQTNGKLIAVGATDIAGVPDIALVRYSATGIVDSTFGNNGIVVTDISSNSADNSGDAAIQTDGKILVAGSTNDDVFLIRYLTNGNIDSSFGTNGLVITDVLSNSPDVTQSLKLQPDGKILVTGWTAVNSTSPQQGFLIRYDIDGSLDNTFGTIGKVTFFANPNSSTLSSGLALQTDQKIVVTSSSIVSINSGLDFCVSRFLNSGGVDSTFGTNGHTITDIDGGNDNSFRIGIQNDGRILVAGNVDNDGNDAIALVRYLDKLSIGTKDFSLTGRRILLYPNPISQQATLEYTLNRDEKIRLDLFDLQGRKLKTIMPLRKILKGVHKQTFSLKEFSTGNYLLIMSSSSGKAVVKIQKK